MSDEIARYGSGVRGVFKWDREKRELVEIKVEKKAPEPKVYIQTDEIPATESMATADRKYFTSKVKLEEYNRAHGFRTTGGDHLHQKISPPSISDKEKRRREMNEDVERAMMDVKYGRVEFTEEQKQLHIEEERAWKRAQERQKAKWAH